MQGAQKLFHTRRASVRLILAFAACALAAACSHNGQTGRTSKLGAAAKPDAVAGAQGTAKHAGRRHLGQAYKVAGKWYHPKEDPGYDKVGMASYYGSGFHGRRTANGEVFNMRALSAAHPTLPLPSYVRVTNLSNGRSVVVRVNDRGPFGHRRIIDVSQKTAEMLDFKRSGSAKVRVQYVEPASLDGDDQKSLLASFTETGPQSAPESKVVAVAYAPPVEAAPDVASGKEMLRAGQGASAEGEGFPVIQAVAPAGGEAGLPGGGEVNFPDASVPATAEAADIALRPSLSQDAPSHTDDRISEAFLASLATLE